MECSSLDVQQALEIRRTTIQRVFEEFCPDVFLVDSRPIGLDGEVLPVLESIRIRRNCRTFLILRDIVDEPEYVKKRWQEDSIYDAIETLYDKVAILGDKSIYPAADHYGLTSFGDKVVYLGYLGDQYSNAPQPIERSGAAGSKYSVLVTVGGGYDGYGLVRSVCEFIQGVSHTSSELSFKIVLGSNSPVRREHLEVAFPLICCRTEIANSVVDLNADLDSADLVVAMCGYNTVTEILEKRKKLIAVPRSHSGREQIIRAEAISKVYDGIWVMPEAMLTPRAIGSVVNEALSAPPPRVEVKMAGNERLIQMLRDNSVNASW